MVMMVAADTASDVVEEKYHKNMFVLSLVVAVVYTHINVHLHLLIQYLV